MIVRLHLELERSILDVSLPKMSISFVLLMNLVVCLSHSIDFVDRSDDAIKVNIGSDDGTDASIELYEDASAGEYAGVLFAFKS